MRITSVCTYVFIASLIASNAAADGERQTPEARAAEQIAALKKAYRKKNVDAISDGITDVSIYYDEVKDKKVRDKLRAVVGRACRYPNDDIKLMAIDAFARMGDPAACKYVLPFVKQSDARKEPPFFDPATRAIETLQPDAAVSTLLGLVKKSKHLGVAGRAMEVLGAYRSSKVKAKILDTIIATVRKEKPGVKGRERLLGPNATGMQARNRWEALAGPMVKTANSLTGQDLDSPTAWFAFYSANKRKPDVLFAAH